MGGGYLGLASSVLAWIWTGGCGKKGGESGVWKRRRKKMGGWEKKGTREEQEQVLVEHNHQ